MSTDELIISGAKQNNLKNISLRLPHNKFIAITGVSGSGKSSLAFDTIFAEGQWRYIESLSTYARLFLEKLDRPDVDAIRNIRPAIALEQRNHVRTSRSTVGTATEIYDYIRLLYTKVARPYCMNCGLELRSWTPSSVFKELIEKFSGARALIVFGSSASVEELGKKGFHRIRQKEGSLGKSEVILDRLVIKDEPRLSDSIETAWGHGNESISVEIIGDSGKPEDVLRFQSELICPDCDIRVLTPQPLLFSFNHPTGACPECKGFGNVLKYSEDRIVPDKDLPLGKGAIEPWDKPAYRWWYRQLVKAAKGHKINLKIPYKKLSGKTKKLLFSGADDFYGLDDFFEALEEKRYKLHVRVFLSRYRKPVTCEHCKGNRLRDEALAFKFDGMDISQISNLSISQLNDLFSNLVLSEHETEMSSEILRQINLKLSFLDRVGIGYLTLNREAKTLSGGESQRINISKQLASLCTG
jgi:excinuclease ABC subunit A